MNEQGVQFESKIVLRRLTEPFKIGSMEQPWWWWLVILSIALVIGIAFVVWMYIKDSRTVRWYWSTSLAAVRILVYLILAVMFLMPARQTYERSEKRSRVIVVFDVSDSMAQISDDPNPRPGAKPATRLA